MNVVELVYSRVYESLIEVTPPYTVIVKLSPDSVRGSTNISNTLKNVSVDPFVGPTTTPSL